MMMLGNNPLKGKNYNQTSQKNEECKIKLDKHNMSSKIGEEGYKTLRSML